MSKRSEDPAFAISKVAGEHGAWGKNLRTTATHISLAFLSLFRSLIFFSIFFSCKNNPGGTDHLTLQQVDSIVNIGLDEYSKNPLGALPYFINAGNAYQSLDSYGKSGNAFLNVAGIYEEYTYHMDSALIYAEYSLNDYRKGSDSLQIANLYKYYGYLVGLNGNVPEGGTIIDTAIGIYTRHDYFQGVAVSQYNLARLAFARREYQKVDSLLDLAEKVWIQERDPFRLFLINQLRLETGMVTSNRLAIDLAIRQNDSILLHTELSDALRANYDKLKEKSSISSSHY